MSTWFTTIRWIFIALICIIAVTAMAIATYDIFLQTQDRMLLAVVFGGYIFLFVASVLVLLGRLSSVRTALALIPKIVVSNTTVSIPKHVYESFLKGIALACEVNLDNVPEEVDSIHGWATPKEKPSMNYKTAACCSLDFIIQKAESISPSFAPPPSVSVRQYMSFIQNAGLVDGLLSSAYCDWYEKARFSLEEWNEREYEEFMKLVTLILRGYP